MRSLSRMLVIVLALALVAPALFIGPAPAAEDVKIALVAPLSGRWARQGQLKKMGADNHLSTIRHT
jgi:branched-chain amino acid transport system substrate-binding protein